VSVFLLLCKMFSRRLLQVYFLQCFNAVHWLTETGNESVPKFITNNTINVFFKLQISTLLISDHNHSFRVLFGKIAFCGTD